MNIVNIRVDSRGMHGQVAVSWIPSLNVDRVIIIDDELINDSMQKQIIKMAKPSNVKLSIISTKRFKERLNEENPYENENIFIIFIRFITLESLKDYINIINEVNLANVSNKEGARMIAKSVYLSDEEIELARGLESSGMNFYYQMVFNDKKENIII